MPREIIVVTAAYGNDRIQAAGGQRNLLAVIAAAGADGVEIRRELFAPQELDALPAFAHTLSLLGLFACYSAPEPLCSPDGKLNPLLPTLLSEAAQLNARWLKVSLGHFRNATALAPLKGWLAQHSVALVVENDQTDCGRLAPMSRFSAAVTEQALPIALTFDMANWLWVGDSAQDAVRELAPLVRYIHVKAAVPHHCHYRAVALDEAPPSWRDLLRQLPADVPRGIEFPLESRDLVAVTRHYVNLLREE